MTEAEHVEEARRETWAGRECPVPECGHRVLNADTGGRHLDRVHDEEGRWAANRYRAVDNVEGGDVVIYDILHGNRWVQSSVTMEVQK